MADAIRIRAAAQFLYEAHQARAPFGPMPQPYAPTNIDEAEAVQEALQQLRVATHGAVAGYKIALTTPVIRQLLGVNAPVAGAILAKTRYDSPATVRWADYVHLGIECEIAFQVRRELPATQGPYSRDAVADAVGAVMAAFELIDDRHADYATFAAHLLPFIADNAWNAGIVLGAPVTGWHTLDLAAVHGTLSINGSVVGEGRGSAVMGHPLEALTWLVNACAQRGKSLSPGLIVTTGSFISPQFVQPGDAARLTVEGLGDVHLQVV